MSEAFIPTPQEAIDAPFDLPERKSIPVFVVRDCYDIRSLDLPDPFETPTAPLNDKENPAGIV